MHGRSLLMLQQQENGISIILYMWFRSSDTVWVKVGIQIHFRSITVCARAVPLLSAAGANVRVQLRLSEEKLGKIFNEFQQKVNYSVLDSGET